MNAATISVETIVLPTYPLPEREEMPIFAENRVHQRSSGRVYPNKVHVRVDHSRKEDRPYTAVHLQNDYLDVWVLPEIGGRIFAAQDKKTGYDFFYRQHVIKPALIGAFGPWISGGVEFNWPYHHRPSGYMPCAYETQVCPDGSVICWLSENDPVDRMEGTVGIVLRPDAAYLETRVRLVNRTPVKHSFLWWENAAVPVNEEYQIFFPHDVTYVNFHYLDSRISYPIAGDNVYNGIDMTEPRDISLHKNTRDATSYFACASKYDFFGGYDQGKQCGVVHIANHHLSPGKKLFTWAYNQLSKSWENALTDTDGQYAELMAGSYSDNQPNFTWLEGYETKEFSQYWYPIHQIGAPDYANLDCAISLQKDHLHVQSTRSLGPCTLCVTAQDGTIQKMQAILQAGTPVSLPWTRPEGLVCVEITDEAGNMIARYAEEISDELKMPPVKDSMPLAEDVLSADTLYLAGVHVEQYRDPAVMPDAYWLEALKRNPDHAPSLLGMARYCYGQCRLAEAKNYAEKAIRVLTQFNARLEHGEAYYLSGLILEALGELDQAYDRYYQAVWNADTAAKAMVRLACLDLRRGDRSSAVEHAKSVLLYDPRNPLAPAVLMLAQPDQAALYGKAALEKDPMNQLVSYLADKERFFSLPQQEPTQLLMDMTFDLESMGQLSACIELLEKFVETQPDQAAFINYAALAYFKHRLGLPYTGLLERAVQAGVGPAYPSRREEIPILEFALKEGVVYAEFLLGCLFYDKRQYALGADYFRRYTEHAPQDAIGWRCLAIADFSHLGRKDEALVLMKKAVQLSGSEQMRFELACLMDKMGVSPAEKIQSLLAAPFTLDNLYTELAKAYNQNREPEKALAVLTGHTFIPCEGGEHAIADQYMFAHYLLGMEKMRCGDYEGAKQSFINALHLPQNLGAGIWNRCKYVPYQFRIAECLDHLGCTEAARKIWEEIVSIRVEFFSNMHLRELPYYQAMASVYLGNQNHAQNLMASYKRQWEAELNRKDNGYFSTTPFFISFMDQPSDMRRAYYLYLCALVNRFDGKESLARQQFQESYRLNSDNLFCGYFAEFC